MTGLSGFLFGSEYHLAFSAVQDGRWGHLANPVSDKSCSRYGRQMTYHLSIAAVLEECEHDPNSLWQAEHLLVGLRAVPDLLKRSVTSQHLTGLTLGDQTTSNLREVERAYKKKSACSMLNSLEQPLHTIYFRNLCAAWTPVDDHSTTKCDSTLCIRYMLGSLVWYYTSFSYVTYFILAKSKGHALAVATNLDVDCTKGLEHVLDRKLQLVIGTR